MPRGGSVLDRFSEREKESLKSILRAFRDVLTRWQERLSADVSRMRVVKLCFHTTFIKMNILVEISKSFMEMHENSKRQQDRSDSIPEAFHPS
jgi:transcriptional regulatory protein LevR